MNIVYIATDQKHEWNCSEWRCVIPAQAIQTLPGHTAHWIMMKDWLTGKADALLEAADLIVYQRNAFGPYLNYLAHWMIQGKTVLLDLDDAYNVMEEKNVAYNFWRMGLNDEKKDIGFVPFEHLKLAGSFLSGYSMPSRKLQEDWMPYGRTFLLPNYPDTDRYPEPILDHIPEETIHIGWGGSFSHIESFENSAILTALTRVLEKDKRVVLDIFGDPEVAKLIWKRIPAYRNSKRLVFHPWVPAIQWPIELSSLDIGLAPLGGAYDRRRSWIKVLEYMLLGIPWVATDLEPYQELREHGILVNNQAKYWEEAIWEQIKCRDLGQIKRAREFAMEQDAARNAAKLIQIFTDAMPWRN